MSQGMHLEELVIVEWTGVAQPTTLRFHDGFNVLLGLNGAGKTTLLELLSAITTGDWRLPVSRLQEGSRFHVEWRTGRARTQFLVEADDGSGQSPRWAARASGAVGPLVYCSIDADKALLHEEGDEVRLWRGSPDGGLMGMLRTNGLRLGRLDESLVAFEDWTSDEPVATLRLGPTSPPQVVSFLLPHSLYDALHPGDDHVVFMPLADHVPGAEQLLGTVSASLAVLERTDKELQLGKLALRYQRAGRTVEHSRWSYGEKRLMALLWYAATVGDQGPLLIDEWVNGLHHTWVEKTVELFSDRQVITASQNPLLLDFLPDFADRDHVQRAFIHCEAQVAADAPFLWRNFTDPESDTFYRAYEAGIEHVSEILRTRNLW